MGVSRSAILSYNNGNNKVCKKIPQKKSLLVQGRKGEILRQAFLRRTQSPILALKECVNNKTRDLEFRSSAKILCKDGSLQDRLPTMEAQIGISKSPLDEFAKVSLSDLKELDILGAGSYGRVSLVKIRGGDRTRTFALKRIKKAGIVKFHGEHHILSEKEVMKQINSDFVVKLHKTFKDERYLYMLIESCLGGELYTLLQRQTRLQEPAAKFYIACVVKAFEHLHSMNIVYRDLKPENLLIDHRGYLKMADFGFARKLDFQEQTHTACGTSEYMAPEVIEDKGHDVRCDYWSLGVLIYELLTGKAPFMDANGNSNKIYAKILKGFKGRRFPGEVTSEPKALILRLCRMEPAERLDGGSIGQMVPISEWFRGFDWEALTTRTMAPPSVPEIKDARDTSNFDYCSSEDEDDYDDDPPADDLPGWDADF